MSRHKRPSWTPAREIKVIKLKPNGPKPGQSTTGWLYGKQRGDQQLIDDPRTAINDLP